MKQLVLIIGLIAIICACQPTAEKEMTSEERQEIATTIKSNFKEMMKMMGDYSLENFEKIKNMYVETNDEAWMNNPAVWVNMLTLWENIEVIAEIWTPTENSRLATKYNIEEEYVAVISPESALYVFKGTFSITDKDGNIGEDYPMSGSYVYVLRNGEWKLFHIHQSWEN